jgi:hypothetical protein
MSLAEGWNYPVVENGYKIFIAEIGGSYDEEIQDVLNATKRDFAQVESLLYLRAFDTGVQKELLEKLGLEWHPVYMPWLLVLEEHPEEIEKGDQAIIFRLGKLETTQIEEVTNDLVSASMEADAIRKLTWEQRKEKFKEKIPVLKETAKMVISVVGVL